MKNNTPKLLTFSQPTGIADDGTIPTWGGGVWTADPTVYQYGPVTPVAENGVSQ